MLLGLIPNLAKSYIALVLNFPVFAKLEYSLARLETASE